MLIILPLKFLLTVNRVCEININSVTLPIFILLVFLFFICNSKVTCTAVLSLFLSFCLPDASSSSVMMKSPSAARKYIVKNVRLLLKGTDKNCFKERAVFIRKKKVFNDIAERQKSLDIIQIQFKTCKKQIIPLQLNDFIYLFWAHLKAMEIFVLNKNLSSISAWGFCTKSKESSVCVLEKEQTFWHFDAQFSSLCL